MLPRSRAKAAGLVGICATALVTAAWLAPGVAAAALNPIVMGPLYAEPARGSDNPAAPSAGGCTVAITEIADTRRAPETLGAMQNFRAIDAPADRGAWLHSVLDVGLTARGFKPSFVTSGSAPAGSVAARFRLQAMWLSTPAMNKTGSVVVRMSATGPSGTAIVDRAYRGDQTAVNWAGTTSEFNGLTNRILANALDAMAADLRPLCPAASTTTAAQ